MDFNPQEIEQIARELCELRKLDPDEEVSVRPPGLPVRIGEILPRRPRYVTMIPEVQEELRRREVDISITNFYIRRQFSQLTAHKHTGTKNDSTTSGN